jgi:hypothetical protein
MPVRLAISILIGLTVLGASVALLGPTSASAAVPLASTANWCGVHGSHFQAWVGVNPDVPICGPGPEYGGSWAEVGLPGPYGLATDVYYNATPGMQCVELSERYLAVVDGLAPVHANGAQVAMNYHAAYPRSHLYVNGSTAAVGHPPVAGDVLSFSYSPSFSYAGGDGHTAIVVRSAIDMKTGNGTIVIAQENVSSSDYLRTLYLSGWRLHDGNDGGTEYGYPYAEWLDARMYRAHAPASGATGALVSSATAQMITQTPTGAATLNLGVPLLSTASKSSEPTEAPVVPAIGLTAASVDFRGGPPPALLRAPSSTDRMLLAGGLGVAALFGAGILVLSGIRRQRHHHLALLAQRVDGRHLRGRHAKATSRLS